MNVTTLSEKFGADSISIQGGTSVGQNATQKLYSTNISTPNNSQDKTIRPSSQKRNKTEKSAPRKNSHGQVKTSRNCSIPKPPLPPLKEKKKTEPTRRSSRQKEIKEKEVWKYFKFTNFIYFQNTQVYGRSIREKYTREVYDCLFILITFE